MKTEETWRKQLTEEQFCILREKATERPFTGVYNDHKEEGTYHCAGCGEALFTSETKFNSGTGWPSFFKPKAEESVTEVEDSSHGMIRTEVLCAKCGGHLGHVFDHPSTPTGLRYCINSGALEFKN